MQFFIADVNVGIGLAIFTYSYSHSFNENGAPIWLYATYVGTIASLYLLVLPVLHRLCKEGKQRRRRRKESNSEEMKLRSKEEDEEEGLMGEKEMCRKESYPLWASFGFFLVLTVTVVAALIVLVAIA